MRPSSLGGGRILRRTLSVCLSVRPVIVTERHVAPPSELQWHTFTFRHALRAAYRTAISAAQILVYQVVFCAILVICALRCSYGTCNFLFIAARWPKLFLFRGPCRTSPESRTRLSEPIVNESKRWLYYNDVSVWNAGGLWGLTWTPQFLALFANSCPRVTAGDQFQLPRRHSPTHWVHPADVSNDKQGGSIPKTINDFVVVSGT